VAYSLVLKNIILYLPSIAFRVFLRTTIHAGMMPANIEATKSTITLIVVGPCSATSIPSEKGKSIGYFTNSGANPKNTASKTKNIDMLVKNID
jgi:hypothetical protein